MTGMNDGDSSHSPIICRQLFFPNDSEESISVENTDNSDESILVEDVDIQAINDSCENNDQNECNAYNNVTTIVPGNIDTTPCPIYSPDWYMSTRIANANTSAKDITNDMKDRNWITDDLLTEIQSLYPDTTEIHTNSVTGICNRDLDAFSVKCFQMFPKGRIFMSYAQLDQATKHFLDGWNCKKVHSSKSIRCAYSKSLKKPYKSVCAPDKRRKIDVSMKQQYQCPFVIRYSSLDYKINNPKSAILYKVKITECNPEHSCQLSSQFYRHACSTSTGQSKIKRSRMNTLLMVLKTDPSTSSNALRPLLSEYLQNDIWINSTFIRNFRQRCAYYHAKNPNHVDVSIEEAELMVSHTNLSDYIC